MILEKQKESLVLEEGQAQESTKMSLDMDSAQILMDMLSKNLYSDSIGSAIRECASNALDSHRKAGTDKPIIVSFDVNDQSNYEFSVEDFGTGLDAKDVVEIISKYGKSTKRQDKNALGMMGLGFKAPLAYTSSFYFVCRKAGVERKYMMYEGEDGNTIDFLYEKPTTEENGVKVIVPVNYADRMKFVVKIREQLCYFEDVFFNVPSLHGQWQDIYSQIKNDFVIFRGDTFQFSEMNQDQKMHICLDNVYYPMDFDKLGIPVINFPVALRFGLSDGLFPTPNRESLRYTKEGIEVILKRLGEVADFFTSKYNEGIDTETGDVFSILEYYTNTSRYVTVGTNKSYDLKELKKYSTIDYVTPKIDGIKLLNIKQIFEERKDYILGEYSLKFKLKQTRMMDMTKGNHDSDFRPLKLNKPDVFVYVYSDRVSGVKKDYIRTIANHNDAHCLVKKDKRRKLGKSANFQIQDYIHLLDLKKYPKNKWREVIKEWEYLVSLFTENFIDLDTYEVPQAYLDSRKKTKFVDPNTGITSARRIKLKGEVVGKQAVDLERYNGGRMCKFVPETYKIEDFEKFKGITLYSSHDDYLKLDQIYGFAKKQKIRIATFSEREMKVLEKADIHNLITLDKFMEGKNSHFKRLVTAYVVNKLITDYRYTFSLMDSLKNVSVEFSDQLKNMQNYANSNYVHENNEVYRSMVAIAEEHNLFDMTIYPEYLVLKETLRKMPFIEPLSKETKQIYDSNKVILNVYADLFKYYGHKVELVHYKRQIPEEEVITDEVLEELED